MKKKLRGLLIVAATLLMVFTFTACENPEEDATKALDTGMAALQTGDMATVEKSIPGIEDLSSMFEADGDEEASLTEEQAAAFFKDIFSNMTYKIEKAEKKDDTTVDVTVKVSNVNMTSVLNAWYTDIFSIAFANYDKSESEIMTLMMESFSKQVSATVDAKDMKESTVVISVLKTEDGWRMNPGNEALDGMTGGFVTASESLGN